MTYQRSYRKQKTRKKGRNIWEINALKTVRQNQHDYAKYWSSYRWDPYTYWPGRISTFIGMLPMRNFSTRRGIIPGQQINV